MVKQDVIIALASTMHVARSNYIKSHLMNEICFNNFLIEK